MKLSKINLHILEFIFSNTNHQVIQNFVGLKKKRSNAPGIWVFARNGWNYSLSWMSKLIFMQQFTEIQVLVGKRSTWNFWTKSLTTFDFLSKPTNIAFSTLYPYFYELLLNVPSSGRQPTFAAIRLSKFSQEIFYLIGKYVHGSGPHEKFWTKSLTTFDFLSEHKIKAFFTLWPYLLGLLLNFLTKPKNDRIRPGNLRGSSS